MPGHVLDACFVEDLQAAGLLAASCTNLVRYGVRVRYLTSLELRHHETMQVHYRALSVADAEALVIARADNAVLLTGDGRLRKAALDSGVDVRGVIGELKRLVAAVVIDPPEALTALETIVASGSRLPHDEGAAARRQWLKMIAKGRGIG
jgi:predicted nucleic acid-binding protein